MKKRAKLAKARKGIDKKVVKGMASSMRTQILTILNERMATATQISKELGVGFGEVSYEMEVLKKAQLIEKVAEERVRGTIAVYYRANARAYLDPSQWPAVADPVKGGLRASLFQNLMDDAVAALSEETYDSLEDAHMSWIPMIVDEQGWEEVTRLLLRTMREAMNIQEECKERLIAEDAEGISCTVSLLGYPSAHENRKVGPPTTAKQLAGSAGWRKAEAEKSAKKKGKATQKPKRKDGPKKGRRAT